MAIRVPHGPGLDWITVLLFKARDCWCLFLLQAPSLVHGAGHREWISGVGSNFDPANGNVDGDDGGERGARLPCQFPWGSPLKLWRASL